MAKWANFFEVSTSGYYGWKKELPQKIERQTTQKERIKKLFDESKQTYGAERICGIMRKEGGKASRAVVKRHMDEMGLVSVHRAQRQKSLTDSRKARGECFESLTRGFDITEVRQVLSSDITYLRTDHGFEYLCVVKDVVSGDVLGHSMSERMTKELVIQAFMNAEARHALPRGIIFHSDRGSQYTSKAFMEILRQYGVRQSFSRVGTPGDNAWSESFFGILKKECVKLQWKLPKEKVRAEIFEYIECFYNRFRVQKRLGYLSPAQYLEMALHSEKQAA